MAKSKCIYQYSNHGNWRNQIKFACRSKRHICTYLNTPTIPSLHHSIKSIWANVNIDRLSHCWSWQTQMTWHHFYLGLFSFRVTCTISFPVIFHVSCTWCRNRYLPLDSSGSTNQNSGSHFPSYHHHLVTRHITVGKQNAMIFMLRGCAWKRRHLSVLLLEVEALGWNGVLNPVFFYLD